MHAERVLRCFFEDVEPNSFCHVTVANDPLEPFQRKSRRILRDILAGKLNKYLVTFALQFEKAFLASLGCHVSFITIETSHTIGIS